MQLVVVSRVRVLSMTTPFISEVTNHAAFSVVLFGTELSLATFNYHLQQQAEDAVTSWLCG